MTAIRLYRTGYGSQLVRLRSEAPEHAAERLRELYPDATRLELIVLSPWGLRLQRCL